MVCDWLTKLAPLSQPMRCKTKTNRPRSHEFSRAWRLLHVFALNSDWFIALFAPVVIGQGNYFGFGSHDYDVREHLVPAKCRHVGGVKTVKRSTQCFRFVLFLVVSTTERSVQSLVFVECRKLSHIKVN